MRIEQSHRFFQHFRITFLLLVALLPNNTLVWKSEEESENTCFVSLFCLIPLCLIAAAFGLPLSILFGTLVHFFLLASVEIVSLISVEVEG